MSEAPKLTKKEILWAMFQGFRCRCPYCGSRTLFDRYLKPTHACSTCGTQYDHIRTDDFAPWLTIIVLGHVFVPLIYTLDTTFHPPVWVSLAVALPFMAIVVLWSLPNFKGACVALMWALGLKGDEVQWHDPDYMDHP